MAEEEQVAVLEQGEGDADNIVSKDVLSVKVSVVLQFDVALNFSFWPGGACNTSL